MREKYESLSLAVLKDLAKARGMKRISTLKKAELIERMLQQDTADAKTVGTETPDTEKQNTMATSAGIDEKQDASNQPGKDTSASDAQSNTAEETASSDAQSNRDDASGTSGESTKNTTEKADKHEETQSPVRRRGRPPKNAGNATQTGTTERGTSEKSPRKNERKPSRFNFVRAGEDSVTERTTDDRAAGKRENAADNRTYGRKNSSYEERANGKRDNAAQERTYGKRENTTEERANGKRENAAQERTYGKRENTTEERNNGKRRGNFEDRNNGKHENTSEERTNGKRENASEDRDHTNRDTSDERRGQVYFTPEKRNGGADAVHEDVKIRDDKREHTKNGKQERRPRPVIITGDPETDEKLKSVDDRTLQRIEAEGVTLDDLDSGIEANGILEVMPDGYGFIRCENYLPGDNDIYVAPSQIRRFKLKTGDILTGHTRVRAQNEKFSALLYIGSVNGINPTVASKRIPFEDLTPIFPNERLRLETSSSRVSMRILDLIAPVGKGQRGMIVSQPKAGKTTLLKEIAKSIKKNNPEMHLIILLIDERPEEVTDIKEAIEGDNVEVIYSTFDELPEHHKRVSEMVIERAKRLVEHKQDVMILLDSITRLARAYNMVVPPSGRTLSGGLDPTALHMPKRFFGAARNMREGGSLTILATALVDTGSRMDDVVYEEFKGTGNMELILDRKLSEKRIFPAIDIVKSGTRRDDLLLDKEEQEAMEIVRRSFNGMKSDDAVETILRMFLKTRTNRDFIHQVIHRKFF